MSDPIVRAEEVALHFDGGATRALDGLDFRLDANEFVAIVGPSGCGKSSLLNLIGALDVPTAGRLFFGAQAYTDIPDLALLRRRRFGFVFQAFHLIATLTALENVLIATIGGPGPRQDARERARELLLELGLGARVHHFPGQMSGGEKQRVAIARALVNTPDVILADEPTGSVDTANAAQVLELLSTLREKRGLAVVMVTHDPNVSRRADRVVHLRDGRVDPAWARAA
jgi:putative ABC transport system ATP-binding protein